MEINIFTDGSFVKRRKSAGFAGYGVYFPDGEYENISSPFLKKPPTNQRAELYAIYVAITTVVGSQQSYERINIYTDSMYSINSLTLWARSWAKNGWKTASKKPVKNLDIIKPLYKLMLKHGAIINLVHVRAHTSSRDTLSLGNAKADEMATNGSKISEKIHKKFTK